MREQGGKGGEEADWQGKGGDAPWGALISERADAD